MLVAGEASGDKHGASLVRALKNLHPETDYQFFGSGGAEMRDAGVQTLVDVRDVAIIGVAEVASAAGRLYRAYRTLLSAARTRRPSIVVLIDWPDFNLRIAKKLHRDAFKIVYYISPQIWAWRKYRIHAMRRDIDRMIVILPFEEEFYRGQGLDVRYVGHPLANVVRTTLNRVEFCSRYGLDPERPIFALLPGSRRKEIAYHLPVMLDAASRLRTFQTCVEPAGIDRAALSSLANQPPGSIAQSSTPQFVIPLASTVRRADIEEALQQVSSSNADEPLYTIIESDTYNALGHSSFAVVASGTATVEAALSGVPMIIIYRGSDLNWRLIRPLIHLKDVGMVNLIAGRRIVPELLQHDATGENIARESIDILSNAVRTTEMRQELARVRELIEAGGSSASERAAQAVLEVLAG